MNKTLVEDDVYMLLKKAQGHAFYINRVVQIAYSKADVSIACK